MELITKEIFATLESETLKITISNKGTITSLYNKKKNTELLNTAKPTGWRVITTLGECKEYLIFEDSNKGEIIESQNQVEIIFQGLNGYEGDKLDIELSLKFSINSSGELEMKTKIINNSKETVREIFFPYISGFTRLSEKKADALLLPLEMGTIMDEPLKNLPVAYKFGIRPRPGGNFYAMDFWPHYPLAYPGVACMPWLDFFNEEQGIYMGYHDYQTPTTAILARKSNEEETFHLGFIRYPFVDAGEAWESGNYILKVHEGGWHDGAICYKEFADTKIKKAVDSPQWIRECPGLHFSFHIGQTRHIVNPYDKMLENSRHNQKLGLKLPLFVFGWVKTGFDNCYPEYQPDPRLGGTEKLKSIINTITGEGGKVILYTQGRLIDKSTEYYKHTGQKVCLKNEYGTEYIDEYSFNDKGTVYPGKVFAVGCPATVEWFEQLKTQIDIVMELGASGILFDQIAGDTPYLCFDKNHPHQKPDMAFHAKIELLDRLREYARSIDSEFVIMSELICDTYLQCVDLSHGMATSRDNSKSVRFFPEMYKYVFPGHRITSRLARSIKDYNQTFALGFVAEYYQNIPEFEYLERLMILRNRLERFFVRGIFLDDENISAKPEGILVKTYLSYKQDEKAVIVINETKERTTARISIIRTSENWDFITPLGDTEQTFITAVNKALEFDLEPDQLAVIIAKY
jgi:hypothetical protein